MLKTSSALLPLLLLLTAASPPEFAQWRGQAARVTITRDDWGIAHVHGRSDADAVFGMIYAQAEDDFPRIEANYLTALGRTAEAEGEQAIWQDLRARLYVSEAQLKADYWKSPQSMRRLMDAWADGLNFYLATHPQVKPRVLTRFEPWMALSFTEGSIGGDIEEIDLKALAAFYGGPRLADKRRDGEPSGSNGIAIAPRLTRDGKPLLLINPHTSFYFRSEAKVESDEGLDAYGASTWGQFFVYQGFNRTMGWMHTSSGVDNIDEFAYDVRGRRYRVGKAWRPLTVKPLAIRYRLPSGAMASRTFTTFATHRGPIVRRDGNRWVAFAMMDRPVEALQQSFLRTKAADIAAYRGVSERLRANSSNVEVLADAKGHIALLAPQFMPIRSARHDYLKTVDGSDPASDWRGLHAPASLPNSADPSGGWLVNTNDWLYSAAGDTSPKPGDFPRYLDKAGENYRTIHANRLLTGSSGWTIEKLRDAAYDRAQPGFEILTPMLVKAFDALPAADPRRAHLAGPVAAMRGWDGRWSVDSVPQTLANFWANEMLVAVLERQWPTHANEYRRMEALDDAAKIAAFDRAVSRIARDFGRWRVPWGEVNRFQRLSGAVDAGFDDSKPSVAVPFASNRWGSLASMGAQPGPNTKRWYGTNGNSFIAIVEFGAKPSAIALTAGGLSNDPANPHFADQLPRYPAGALRAVYFDDADLAGHIERSYRPGE